MSKEKQKKEEGGFSITGDDIFFSILDQVDEGPAKELVKGNYFLDDGRLDSAETCFDKAAQEAKQEETLVDALVDKAKVYTKREECEKAKEILNRAKGLAKDLDPSCLGDIHRQMAEVADLEGNLEEAMDYFKKAKDDFSLSEEDTSKKCSEMLLNMAGKAQMLNNYRDAVDYSSEGQRLAQEVEKGDLVFFQTWTKAEALSGLGKAKEAVEAYEHAEELLVKNKDELKYVDKEEIREEITQKKATNFHLLGNFGKSSDLYEDVLNYNLDGRERAGICASLSLIKFSMGLPDDAANLEEEAKDIIDGSEEGMPDALLDLSRLNLLRGHIDKSDRQLFQALVEIPGEESKSTKLHEINLDIQKANIQSASEEADSLYEETMNDDFEQFLPYILNTMGTIAVINEMTDKAEKLYKKSLQVADKFNLRASVSSALGGLSIVALIQFDTSTAMDYLEKAIRISKECGWQFNTQLLLVNRARILGRENSSNTSEAVSSLKELLSKSRSFKSLVLELDIRDALAELYRQTSRYSQAREQLEITIEKATGAEMELLKVISQGLLGIVLSDQGNRKLAKKHLEKAISKMEDMGLDIGSKIEFEERYRDLTGFWF